MFFKAPNWQINWKIYYIYVVGHTIGNNRPLKPQIRIKYILYLM
jgi:hypothetical protein